MSSEVPFIRPNFPPAEQVGAAYAAIVEANWFTNFGPRERDFARQLASYLGQGMHVSTFANGTLALLAALHATVGRGDGTTCILMPSFTFVAGAQVCWWSGHRPAFVDMDPVTWQPDAGSARMILEESRAEIAGILLGNSFGIGNPDIGAWEDLAAEFELPLVIDSAAGFGSRYADGERVGGRGDCEIFSFHATKPFAVGEGGAVASRHASVIERVQRWQNFGFGPDRQSIELGMNGKLQELNAAIGLLQLEGLDRRIAGRRAAYDHYRQELSPRGLTFAVNAEHSSLCFASACADTPELKAAMLAGLHRRGVEARDYYNPPLHRQEYLRANPELSRAGSLPVTDDVCQRILSLPIHDHMDPSDTKRVVDAVLEVAP